MDTNTTTPTKQRTPILTYIFRAVGGLILLTLAITLTVSRVHSDNHTQWGDPYVQQAYATLVQRKGREKEIMTHKDETQRQIDTLQKKIDHDNKLLEDNLIYMKTAKVTVCHYKHTHPWTYTDLDCRNVSLPWRFTQPQS